MNFRTSRRGGLQRLLLAGAIGLTTLSAPAFSAPTPVKGGTISVATIGEPPTLDPMSSTADLVGILTQHFFETLYTFDAQWNLTPLLADKMPEISADGLVYTIPLRQGITFHDGSKMDSSDVLASLKRWTETATRGKGAAKVISSIEAPDANTIRITLKQPYSPLTALLAMNNAAAVIMPKGKIAPVLTEIVGTGPTTQGARAGPVHPAGALRRLQAARRRARRLRRCPQAVPGRNPLRAGEQRQHPHRSRRGRPVRLRRLAAGGIAGQAQGRPLRSGHAQAFRLAAPGAQHQAGHHVQPGRAPGRAAGAERRGHAVRRLRQQGVLQAQRRPVPRGLPWATSLGGKVYNKADTAAAKKRWTAPTSPTRRSAS